MPWGGSLTGKADYQSLPKKRMAAGCLLFDSLGRVLFLMPGYKPQWEIPGGVVEKNESPLACCRREVCEEIGLDLEIGELLVVDYVPEIKEKTEGVMFLFNGGRLSVEQIDQIVLQSDEIIEFRFFPPDQLPEALTPSRRRRIQAGLARLEGNPTVYLED